MKTYSFIIPHHNSPQLLQRLIDTIPQREDIEIIVVDDNSDEDKKACIKRQNVKTFYINKEETKGAGKARNVGIDNATGKWLLFADADDLYKPNFIDVLDEYKDNDIEILFFNVDSVNSETLLPGKRDRGAFQQRLIKQYDGSEKTANNLLFMSYGPWRKMISSDYIKKFGFRFEEIPITNDSFFSLQTSYFAKKWKVDNRILYTLTYCEGSLTYSKLTKKKYTTIFNVFRRRAKLFEYMGHPEWNKVSFRGYKQQSCLRYLRTIYRQQPLSVAIQATFYYLTHLYSIEKNSGYYVDVIKDINNRVSK